MCIPPYKLSIQHPPRERGGGGGGADGGDGSGKDGCDGDGGGGGGGSSGGGGDGGKKKATYSEVAARTAAPSPRSCVALVPRNGC